MLGKEAKLGESETMEKTSLSFVRSFECHKAKRREGQLTRVFSGIRCGHGWPGYYPRTPFPH